MKELAPCELILCQSKKDQDPGDKDESPKAAASLEDRFAALEKAYKEVCLQSRMKDEFIATLSHELRTPLNVILGFAELLIEEKPDSEDFSEALQAIYRNARIQADLINDLLDVSKIITGRFTLTLTTINLQELMQEIVDSARLTTASKHITIESEIDSSVPLIQGDVARLQQIVWNVVTNAIKFTPEKGVISLVLRRSGEQVEICVKDTGHGIEPEFLPYVFDRFRQGSSRIHPKHSGMGLGLAIVKHLAELHGGSVSAESSGLNQGTTISVFLPLQVPPKPQQRQQFW